MFAQHEINLKIKIHNHATNIIKPLNPSITTTPDDVLSSAYAPIFISIWLSNDWIRMLYACLSAFGISFLGTLLNYVFAFYVLGSTNDENKIKQKQESLLHVFMHFIALIISSLRMC